MTVDTRARVLLHERGPALFAGTYQRKESLYMSSSTTKEKTTAEAAVPGPLTLLSIGSDLHKPFPPGDIVFLPKGESPPEEGKPEGNWTCKAYPYASVWKYVMRLN